MISRRLGASLKLHLKLSVAFIVLGLSPVYVDVANAASLTVSVKQVNPEGVAQTITCDLLKSDCDLPLILNSGQSTAQSINIHVVNFEGGLALNFKAADGYFYTDSTVNTSIKYNALWNRLIKSGSTETYTVTLFTPLAARLIGPGSISSETHTAAAKLEVTATSNP